MLSILKTIFFKLYLNLIGAVYLVKENVIRPRRLPDYPSQGESWSSDYKTAELITPFPLQRGRLW